jgi:hypothetical protein
MITCKACLLLAVFTPKMESCFISAGRMHRLISRTAVITQDAEPLCTYGSKKVVKDAKEDNKEKGNLPF